MFYYDFLELLLKKYDGCNLNCAKWININSNSYNNCNSCNSTSNSNSNSAVSNNSRRSEVCYCPYFYWSRPPTGPSKSRSTQLDKPRNWLPFRKPPNCWHGVCPHSYYPSSSTMVQAGRYGSCRDHVGGIRQRI